MTRVRTIAIFSGLVFLLVGGHLGTNVGAQNQTTVPSGTPTAWLTRAAPIVLTGRVDSNSPAVWDLADGLTLLHVFTSIDGWPSLAIGADMQRLGPAQPVNLQRFEGGGYWMEAVVADDVGTLYGYYHNERPATMCPAASDKVVPRIGAARSIDGGRTWENLGIIIEAARGTLDCASTNKYFVGGVGDLSVMLDPESKDLYIFYSEYARQLAGQGVGVARLLWADRDAPVGKVSIWRSGAWLPAREVRQMRDNGSEELRLIYPNATSLYPTTDSWHDSNGSTDAFWGPAVHWNTYLQQYVMLLNRSKNGQFDQEGIYISFAPSLEDPSMWSPPQKILNGGGWYPQVLGLEPTLGSDKVAGERARLFVTGRSEYIIEFDK